MAAWSASPLAPQGTAGEIINTITGPNITAGIGGLGVHNVAQAFTNGSTQSTQQHTPGLWNDAWTPYDTYFMYNTAQTLSAGSDFTDTQNGATTGTLGLPSVPAAPQSGFGTYSSSATSAKVILAPNADSNVPFLYLVLRGSDIGLLDVRVDGQLPGGGGTFQVFTDYMFYIPEPATIGLVCMAAVGCFGITRRR